MAKKQAYGNASITTLKGAERVRKRPAVIFGSDGLDGCEHAVFEILSNAIDEAREGYGKLIIEACLLTDEEKVKACTVAKLAGAAFVKTSTGYSTGGATVEDVRLMRETVGPEMGVKASGGVRTYDDAVAMLKAGANRLGCSSTMKIVSGVKEDEHKCVNCGNCKNQCPSGNVEIRKKLY